MCRRYTDYVSLRRRFELELVDARQRPDLVRAWRARGVDIDDGFIIVENDRWHQGAEAAAWLERNTEAGGRLDAAKKAVLQLPGMMRFAYRVAWVLRRGLFRLVLRRDAKI
jgi:hypothetical protein